MKVMKRVRKYYGSEETEQEEYLNASWNLVGSCNSKRMLVNIETGTKSVIYINRNVPILLF